MKAPQIWYNYLYFYPDGYVKGGVDLTDVVLYVGKGTKGRMYNHEREAEKGCSCDKCQAIRDVWASSLPLKMCHAIQA